MSLEENKAIIRSLYEAFNKHNPDLLDDLMAPDFVDAPNTPFELRGLESYKKFEAMFVKGFPDYHDTIEGIIAEGDKVWVLGKVKGTHRRMEIPGDYIRPYWQEDRVDGC